eukprot:CAMPEP_0116966376 /NCGR_PEP_ID=MMETSP0467-20121206/49820_1 /TAXON_ID=283647 /ORGANISM="Mesodinium pulex, Strain SPMC105" /LENGTH=56 /DNA_ID=CAMNT_0004655885 /DNA_START=67 /DNA_END=234 /DNA_ORIENTATION=+
MPLPGPWRKCQGGSSLSPDSFRSSPPALSLARMACTRALDAWRWGGVRRGSEAPRA